MVRILGMKGVEIVLAPVAVANQLTDYLIPGHAVENRVHIAYVNFCGRPFFGNSKVFNSTGAKVLDLGEDDEGVFSVVLERNKKIQIISEITDQNCIKDWILDLQY